MSSIAVVQTKRKTSRVVDQNTCQSEPIFGTHAVALKRLGLAVIPAKGKTPIRQGFSTWKNAPGLATVEKWAKKNATDNIVFLPGLSRSKPNPNGLVVVDADSANEVERAEKVFGETPAMTDTRRGRHFIYRASGERIPINSLRKFGIEIDIKHGQAGAGICVAPPSRHPDETSFIYGWSENSAPEALLDIPTFNVRALEALIEKGSKTQHNATGLPPPPRPHSTLRDGSRHLGLNDHLAKNAWAFENFDDCLDVARTWNDQLPDKHFERLPDADVVKLCKKVMADLAVGKLVRTHQRRATCTSDGDELGHLLANYDNGDSAHALLMKFRAEHAGRDGRDEPFAIAIKAMVKAKSMGRWSERKLRAARDTLVDAGHIEQVSVAGYRRAPRYRLVQRVLTPSLQLKAKLFV